MSDTDETKFKIQIEPNADRDTISVWWSLEDKKGDEKKGWSPLPRTQLHAVFNIAKVSKTMRLRLIANALKLWCRPDIMARRAAGEDITHTLQYELSDDDFVAKGGPTGPKDPVKVAGGAAARMDEAQLVALQAQIEALLAAKKNS